MSKPFAVFDIDGTLFRSSLVIEFVRSAIDIGLFPESARNDYTDTYNSWKHRTHENAYEEYIDSVVKTYLDNVAGKTTEEVRDLSKTVVENAHRKTYVFTRDLIKALNKTHYTIAISGSSIEVLEPFAKHYGFDLYHGSELEVIDGKYTGKDFLLGHHKKDETLKSIIEKYDLEFTGSVAVGDTGPDIPMLELAHNPIAFNPSRELYDYARKADWKIVVERKNMIYQLDPKDGKYILAS